MQLDSHGKVLGSILLVAGCCIGAGMLGLPVLSALAGFTPSIAMFALSWAFMVCTGLLLLEVNLWFVDEVNIVSMAERTLGIVGKALAWGLFVFLFYSLLVAYISASGVLFSDILQQTAGITISPWIGCLIFTILLGILLYIGTLAIDLCNRILMIGLIASYIVLVILGSQYVNPEFLKHQDWSKSFIVLPAMIISFGFHNLVPSLTTYLQHNRKQLVTTILIGSAIPLFVYLLWEWLILGLVPIEGGFKEALDQGQMATQALKSAVGSPWVVVVAQHFAFFAIVTSFVGVALSFVDFLADGLHIKKTAIGKAWLCALGLLPPFFFALVYPNIFLMALNYAGAFGAVILFGIMPAAMVWSGRYYKKFSSKPLVPGGRPLLMLIILFSCLVVALQLIQEIINW